MKFKFLILLAMTAVLPLVAAAQKDNFIGYRHKGVVFGAKVSNGAENLGGGLLGNENYGVSRYAKNKRQYLWLEKITGRGGDGVPNWIVKDVLEFKTVKKNQNFLFSYSSTCTQNGKENFNLIVLAELHPQKKVYKVAEAWRANLRREKFEKVSVAGIKCRYVAP